MDLLDDPPLIDPGDAAASVLRSREVTAPTRDATTANLKHAAQQSVMILEVRTYTIRTNLVGEYLALYEREGYVPHTRHLGEPVGWFTSEIGTLNQVVHMWRYTSHAERETKRAALYADPEWLAFVPKTRSFIERMENQILVPASFSPMR